MTAKRRKTAGLSGDLDLDKARVEEVRAAADRVLEDQMREVEWRDYLYAMQESMKAEYERAMMEEMEWRERMEEEERWLRNRRW